MKLILLINLPPYLPVFQMLAGERAIAKEIEIREIKNVDFILLDKEEVQRSAHIVIFQDIVSLFAGRNIPRNHQNLKKRNSKKSLILAKIRITAKKMALYLILPQPLFPMNFIHLRP